MEQGAEQKRIAEISSELRKHVTGLIELIDRGMPKSGGSEFDRSGLDPEDVKAFDALCIALSNERCLRDDFHELRLAAERIEAALNSTEVHGMTASGLQPRSVGLAAFIGEAVKGATWRNARSSPNSWNTTAREYQRWGVAIGPQSKEFSRFLSVVLGEDVKPRQIERAFETAKEQIHAKARRAVEAGNTETAEAIRKHPLFLANPK